MQTAADSPWGKVHDAFVETLVHEASLWLERYEATPDRGAETDREIEAHREQRAQLEDELASLGGPSGLTTLRQATGLSDVEVGAVTLTFAAELDATTAHACARISGESRAVPTAGVVAAVFGHTAGDIALLHAPRSACRRFHVFTPVDSVVPASRRPLRLDARVVDHLCGRGALDERLMGLVDPLPVLPMARTHEALVARLVAWLTAPDGPGGRRLNLIGPPERGADAIAAALARALGFVPLHLHLDRVMTRSDRLDLVRLIDREAVLLPALVYVDADGTDDAAAAVAASEVIDALGGLVIVASRTRWDGGDDAAAVVRTPAVDAGGREELWRAALGDDVGDIELAGLVEQFRLGPAGVRDAAARARTLVALSGERRGVTTQDLWEASRDFVGADLGRLAQRITPGATWDQLVLPDAETALLRQIAAQVAQRPRVYEQWGFGDRLLRGRGISALFTGPPGTGKTMAAEILAAELALDLYRIDLSSVISKYIGETEKNLRRVFDAADAGGAILFFDEADALFGKRTEVSDSHDRHANVEINYLLQCMEDYAGLAILATNRKSDLDPAFLRRIRFMVPFPFPKTASRRRIWQTVFPADVPRDDLDYGALARLEIAGGNIRTIAVNAAFLAADADEPVRMHHLMTAAVHEYRKLDKLPNAAEFGVHYEAVRP